MAVPAGLWRQPPATSTSRRKSLMCNSQGLQIRYKSIWQEFFSALAPGSYFRIQPEQNRLETSLSCGTATWQKEGSDSDSDDKDSLQARGDLGLQMNYAFVKGIVLSFPDSWVRIWYHLHEAESRLSRWRVLVGMEVPKLASGRSWTNRMGW